MEAVGCVVGSVGVSSMTVTISSTAPRSLDMFSSSSATHAGMLGRGLGKSIGTRFSTSTFSSPSIRLRKKKEAFSVFPCFCR